MKTAIKLIINISVCIILMIIFSLVIAFNIYAFKFTNQFSDAFRISSVLLNTSFLLNFFNQIVSELAENDTKNF